MSIGTHHHHTTEQEMPSCGLHRTVRLIGDMWTLMIVHNLMSGEKRFGELLEALGNVSPKTLSQRLKMLEGVKLVTRHAYAEIPPRVEYRLTEKGLALFDIVKAMEEFGEHYLTSSESQAACQPVSECADVESGDELL